VPSTQFSAAPIDQVLDWRIRGTIEDANRLREKRKKIVALWKENTKHY
jgi:hypothetical protein